MNDILFVSGNAILTLKHNDAVKIMTVRSTAFPPAEAGGSGSVDNCEYLLDIVL